MCISCLGIRAHPCTETGRGMRRQKQIILGKRGTVTDYGAEETLILLSHRRDAGATSAVWLSPTVHGHGSPAHGGREGDALAGTNHLGTLSDPNPDEVFAFSCPTT